jgi:hypothetical protein
VARPADSLPTSNMTASRKGLGLTLSPDGKLSGTPTAPWLYRFSVVLSDAPGDFVTSTYTLEVLN